MVDHYFIANSTGTGISPKFASAGDGGASYIVAAKVAGVRAPDPANIDWLQLANVQGTPRVSARLSLKLNVSSLNAPSVCVGDFAKTVFRVDTKAGQPPSSVSPLVSARQRSLIVLGSVHPVRILSVSHTRLSTVRVHPYSGTPVN